MVVFLYKSLQWVNVKQKLFRQISAYHNQAYQGIIQPYLNIFRTLINLCILRTVVYPEPQCIQNPVKHLP